MKKLLSISLTILLAIVITYAGSGINAYSFCCEDCHTFGVEAIVAEKCCDTHHDEQSAEQESNDIIICDTSHDQCSLDRLDIDLQDAPSEHNQTQIAIHLLDTYFTTLLFSSNRIEPDETIIGFVSQTQRPPNLSEMVYFTMLETLII
jgi:hypothetical protein